MENTIKLITFSYEQGETYVLLINGIPIMDSVNNPCPNPFGLAQELMNALGITLTCKNINQDDAYAQLGNSNCLDRYEEAPLSIDDIIYVAQNRGTKQVYYPTARQEVDPQYKDNDPWNLDPGANIEIPSTTLGADDLIKLLTESHEIAWFDLITEQELWESTGGGDHQESIRSQIPLILGSNRSLGKATLNHLCGFNYQNS